MVAGAALEQPSGSRRLLRSPHLIRRLVVVDFALALAALLAVVAIGDPGGGALLVEPAPFDRSDFRRRDGGSFRAQGELVDPGSGSIEVGPGSVPPAGPPGQPSPGEGEWQGRAPAPSAPPAVVVDGEARPGRTVPPRDGTYRQRVTTTSDDGEEERESITTYTTTEKSDDETRQRVDGDGGGIFISPGFGGEQDLSWRRDGLYAAQATDESEDSVGGGEECEPEEYLLLRLPLEAGTKWQARVDCTFGFGTGFGGSMHSESSSVVVASSFVEVAGQRVAVWEIRTSMRATGEFSNEGETERFEMTMDAIQYFSPSHGLFVLSHGSFRGSDGSEEQQGTFRSEALHLDPE